MIVERFVDAAIESSQKGLTENQAATYYTSDDPRIDFFFKVLEDTDDNETINLLEKSWNHNCLDTLRLIAYLRDIRSGKSIRYQYYVCLYWIYNHHPRTLLQNLPILIDCGYWKDPFQLLMVILFKGKISNYLFQEEYNVSKKKSNLIKNKKQLTKNLKNKPVSKTTKKAVKFIKFKFYKTIKSEINENLVQYYKEEIDKKYKPLINIEKKFTNKTGDEQSDHSTDLDKQVEIKQRTVNQVDKKYLKELKIKYARERFNDDKKYRYFHLRIAEIIAKKLIEDSENLKNNKLKQISLAAKWCPSLNGHFDKYTLIASSIALQIAKLTREQDANVEEIFNKSSIPVATYLARKNYTKNYIVKLREQLRIPERFMCANQWDSLPYEMVPSKCMQKNRKIFLEHDHDRFEQFIKSKTKIAGATLKPPELIERAINLSNENELEKELLEKQWNSLRDSIKLDNKDSCFNSALSVCDVSGSMHGTPMNAAIGLTLMTMSFTNEPWSNICLTFSEKPQFVHFEKNQTLYQKVNQLINADAGFNTDLTKTFQLILEIAKKHELKQNEMPKYLFIFSDMEFDCACNPKETNFEEAKRLFAESGYELPTIVFWNLRDSKSIPIQKAEHGTILLSGYSAQQLSLLLNMNIDQITPFIFIEEVLNMKKYVDLVVID